VPPSARREACPCAGPTSVNIACDAAVGAETSSEHVSDHRGVDGRAHAGPTFHCGRGAPAPCKYGPGTPSATPSGRRRAPIPAGRGPIHTWRARPGGAASSGRRVGRRGVAG
jgi:hypothetical protein